MAMCVPGMISFMNFFGSKTTLISKIPMYFTQKIFHKQQFCIFVTMMILDDYHE